MGCPSKDLQSEKISSTLILYLVKSILGVGNFVNDSLKKKLKIWDA